LALTIHSFEVQGEAVDLMDLGVEPVSLSSQFGSGATLTLVQTRDHHKAALQPNTAVSYKADGVTRFVGVVRSVARRTSDDAVAYSVMDAIARAESTTISIDVSGFSHTVSSVVSAALADAGLAEGAGISELAATSSVPMPFTGTLGQLLRDAMASEPEYRLIVNPVSGVELIDAVKVYQSGVSKSLQWGGDVGVSDPQDDLLGRVINASLQESVEGTHTAVVLIQPARKSGSSTFDKEAVLSPGWLSSKEAAWNISSAGVANAADAAISGDPSTQDFMVWRAWQLASSVSDFDPSQPWKLMVLVDVNPRHSLGAQRWYPIDSEYVELNQKQVQLLGPDVITKRFVIAKHPITTSGNVRVKGKAKGPTTAKLIYQAIRGGGSVASAIRIPGAGFEGTAYTRYGVTSVKRIEVSDNRFVTYARARRALDALKDVRHTGSVEVYGIMPTWSWMGGVTVNINGLTGSGTPVLSDYESVSFTQTGWSVGFKNDTYTIELTDSRSEFVDMGRLT